MSEQKKTKEEFTIKLLQLQQENNSVKSVYDKDTLSEKILVDNDSKGESGGKDLIFYFTIPYNTEPEERKSINNAVFNQ